jgi:hypothetical protein
MNRESKVPLQRAIAKIRKGGKFGKIKKVQQAVQQGKGKR